MFIALLILSCRCCQKDTRGHQMGEQINEDIYKQNNMLPIVRVINKNTLRWCGHVMGREEESTLRVVMKGKEIKRKTNTKVAR